MTVVEKEAIAYSNKIMNVVINVTNVKNQLDSKLYSFTRDRDKLYFLRVLQETIRQKKVNHEKVCKGNGCTEVEDYETILFVIEQEHESINRYFEPEIKREDDFSVDEQINLHNKINEVLDHLSSLKMGQEIIFDEIDTLRQHFNLGKKNWFQLLAGKLFTLMTDKLIDETVVKDIYQQLSDGVTAVTINLNT
ncbi:hypothetical protein GN157_00430 [Flavobacterium rakeshii]|uniref:Uncharacterized protein n=1 Tax=Flavobacterium rakeshii TaxID=1038845 RepID=A0A6N8H8A8_9FLAO|nr:hypothetical protein [Flavobacterium rakeshii]MEE1898101.1 hypothetical protein [Flavobacterium rakeshii]MUV02163.1 hypothetical protein [Flavobacterium rakeshii]